MSEESGAFRMKKPAGKNQIIELSVNGIEIQAAQGETVAGALLAEGERVCQVHNERPLGVFCNIGICYNCLMHIDGRYGVRACQTKVKPGMRVETRNVMRDSEK